jgi:hypothetical protein
MVPVRKRRTKLVALGAIVAVALVAVGGFAVVNRSSGWSPAAEPSPSGAWSSFKSPDQRWSVMFPGSATPRAMSMTMPAGTTQIQLTFYTVTSNGVAYEAGAEEIPGDQLSGDPKTVLDSFEQGIKIWGNITGSRDVTFLGQQARELKFSYTNMSLEGVLRYWRSGNRIYLVMVVAKPGATMYPEHFFDTFNES